MAADEVSPCAYAPILSSGTVAKDSLVGSNHTGAQIRHHPKACNHKLTQGHL